MITVTERGHTEIGQAEWAVLQESDDFWCLVECKVLAVTALPGGRARLDGSNLVGRALCDGTVLEFNEKLPGALLALLTAGRPAFKTVTSAAPLTELGPLVALLAQAFVEEVRDYVGAGRKWTYRIQRMTSSTIGGRLNVSATLRLRASGMRHLASFERHVISHATDLNRLLYAGLREIEVLARLMPVGEKTLSGARAISLFFDDCRDAEVVFGSSEALARSAAVLGGSAKYDKYASMLALAGVLLSHNSFDPGEAIPGIAPFSWFVNLSTLFEDTVRRRLAAVVATESLVTLGRDSTVAVFPETAVLIADPDMVVTNSDLTAVGDVKYKNWSGAADASDLYQLLVHARAFGGGRGFLIYPSDSFSELHLGPAVTGCEIWLFAVDVRNLDEGLRAACASMSIGTLEAASVAELAV
jgi:5-methylcytosine-specific restriction endonuclease McrBC regulatory subunit McrC